MKHHPVAAALLLGLGIPLLHPTEAQAAFIRRGVIKQNPVTGYSRVQAIVPEDGDTTIAGLSAKVEGEDAEEELTLTETNAWLHGVAWIESLPAEEAAVSFAVYDQKSATLLSFSGTLKADGSLSFSADEACTAKEGCPDIEIIGAELFATDGGHELAFDLAGADAYDIAYADLTLSETSQVKLCLATDKSGNCSLWGPGEELTLSEAEVGFDSIGSVWEGDLSIEPEDYLKLKIKTLDAKGKKIDNFSGHLGRPWWNEEDGISTIATDEDPLTTLGLLDDDGYALSVVSEGWTQGDELPTHAELALTDGETLTIAANSYQRRGFDTVFAAGEWEAKGLSPELKLGTSAGSITWSGVSFEDLSVPLCAEGLCVVLSPDEVGGLLVSLTQYRWDDAFPDDAVSVSVRLIDEDGKEQDAEELKLDFDDELMVLFSNPIKFLGDPTNSGLSGKLKLLGPADEKGKQETLAKGKFTAGLARTIDGEVGCALIDDAQFASKTDGTDFTPGEAATIGSEKGGYTDTPPVVGGTMARASGGPGEMTMAQLNLCAPRRSQFATINF